MKRKEIQLGRQLKRINSQLKRMNTGIRYLVAVLQDVQISQSEEGEGASGDVPKELNRKVRNSKIKTPDNSYWG